jgi:hypothetical protein
MQRIRALAAISEDERVRNISDVDFWMDKLTVKENVATGRICRVQTAHLPPQALPGGKLTPLGVRAIGPHSIWQYEPKLSVIAIESTRSGAGLGKLLAYIRAACDCRGYAYAPVVDDATLAAAQHGRIRELAMRIATPKNLESVTAAQRRIKQGLVELMGAQIATQIEIRFSVTARDPDIPTNRFVQAAKWLIRERKADRGTISKLQARVVEDDGHGNMLDLLDAHLGARADLDLPNDDPDLSAAVRFANISQVFNTYRPTLEKQFGK